MTSNSDILEIRLYDSSHQIFFKSKARIKDKKEMRNLKKEIKTKGIDFLGNDWFD
jgi:hypothetical protein